MRAHLHKHQGRSYDQDLCYNREEQGTTDLPAVGPRRGIACLRPSLLWCDQCHLEVQIRSCSFQMCTVQVNQDVIKM